MSPACSPGSFIELPACSSLLALRCLCWCYGLVCLPAGLFNTATLLFSTSHTHKLHPSSILRLYLCKPQARLRISDSFKQRYTRVIMVPGTSPNLDHLEPPEGGHVFIFHAAVGSKTGRAAISGNGNVGSVMSGQGEIPVLDLDDVIPKWATSIYFLKIDTQGYELNVLEGSMRLLQSNRIRYILFEFSPELMVRGKTGEPLTLLGMLPALDYVCFDMMGEHLTLPRPSSLGKFYADLLGWHKYGPGIEHPKSVEGFGPWDDIMCANMKHILHS